MFDKIKSALGFAGAGGETMPMPFASLALGGSIPSGSFSGGVETAHMPGIYRETGDAVMDAAPLTAARATGALFNSDLGGAVDVAIGQIVGTGLRPNVQPVAELIGWTPDQADKWARRVERLFTLWAENPRECDSAGLQSFGQMQRAALRAYFGQGEIISIFPTEKRRGDLFSAKVALLDPERLHETGNVGADRHGLKFTNGRPTGLMVQDRDPVTRSTDWQTRTIPFNSKSGRPLSALIFDHVAPVQWRGISPLAAALKPHFQFGKLADATLAGAVLQSVLAATITSNATSEEVMQIFSNGDSDATAMDSYVSAKLSWYRQNSLKGLPNAIHLLPGETLDFKRAEAEADNLADFSRLLKLEIARSLGIGYSAATGDYSGATYSSVRMETAVNWPIVMQRRAGIAGRFCQHAFEAWLENAVLEGKIEVPGGYPNFTAMRAAFTRAQWRGPSMPQADENKSANASRTRLSTGTTSLASECEAMGLDWQDVLTQRAREKAFAKQIGLPDPHVDDPESVTAPTAEAAMILDHNHISGSNSRLTFAEATERLGELQDRMADPAALHPKIGPNDSAETGRAKYERTKADKVATAKRIAALETQIEQVQEAL